MFSIGEPADRSCNPATVRGGVVAAGTKPLVGPLAVLRAIATQSPALDFLLFYHGLGPILRDATALYREPKRGGIQ